MTLADAPITPGMNPFEESVARRLADARGQLSPNDQRIAEFIQPRLDTLAFNSSDSLGQAVGVSRAAVVRFARRLGYAGYAELRDAARQALKESQESPLSRFQNPDTGSLVERKVIQDGRNLRATATLVQDSLESTAARISRAKRVFVVGGRKSYALALYLHRLLVDVRDEVRLIDPGFSDELAQTGEGDLVVAFLFRRYARITTELLADLTQHGAELAVITDGRGHDFSAGASEVLVAATDSPTLYDSIVAPAWLVEILVAEVAAQDRERSRATLERTERFIEDRRLLDN